MIRYGSLIVVSAVLFLGGCAGLSQFHTPLKNPSTKLSKSDSEYVTALTEIGAASTPEEKKLRSNQEIERRLKVLDLNFNVFQTKILIENVQANFGVSITEPGVGAAGVLVPETMSQILSAISGGLTDTQKAYAKAALFDKVLSSLPAQMIANHEAVMVKIYELITRDIDEYSLAEFAQDIESYYFSGSLPPA